METQQTRTPIQNREALLYNFALPVIKGSTAITAAMGTTDQASINTNGALVVAEDTVANLKTQLSGGGTLTIAAHPDVARNIVVEIHNDSGGPLDLTIDAVALALRVTGTFRGVAQTEDITCTCINANKSVANTKFRAWAGAKPFDKVTSITLVPGATWPPDTIKAGVGIGCLVGLPNKPYKNESSDFEKIMIDSANVAYSSQLNSTNQTFSIGTLADSKSVMINYWVNLSDIRRRLMGV